METQFPLPPKSRMKLLECQNAPFSYPFWGEGVFVLRLFCQRFRVIKQDTGELKKLFILTLQNIKAIPPSWDVKKSLAVVSLWHQTVGSCSWRHNGHSECTHPWVFLEQADWGILQTDERVEKKGNRVHSRREMAQTYARLMEISRSVICRVLPSGPKCDSRWI